MVTQVITILKSIVDSFLHVWPYLLVTIPLAAAVNMSGAARYISKALNVRPITAILLATLVGAFSPFCSCGVIPIMAALLLGGFPLAPVMTFCIASPTMDVEVFFLSVTALGWELAIWRLATTIVLSIAGGVITYIAVQRGWLGEQILRSQKAPSVSGGRTCVTQTIKKGWRRITSTVSALFSPPQTAFANMAPSAQTACCGMAEAFVVPESQTVAASSGSGCASGCQSASIQPEQSSSGCGCASQSSSFSQKLMKEIWSATTMVVKFMLLAFFLKAIIAMYVPSEWILRFLGPQNPHAVLAAALFGIPVYTSNLTALPLMSGLLAQGMNPGAVLAFLIAGPTTTIPAMAAVWGITSRRVFLLYLGIAFFGALIAGYLYNLLSAF